MLSRRLQRALPALLVLGACATNATMPRDLAAQLAEAPTEPASRIWIDGDRIVAAAIAVGPGALPLAVRTTIDAVAPRGELLFQGREWSARGDGFRIEKRYRENAIEHTRSALIAANGDVLERSHSVPIAEAPQNVLAAAMERGHRVDEVRIVSGATQEEYWSCTVSNRIGAVYVVDVSLTGKLLRTKRRAAVRAES